MKTSRAWTRTEITAQQVRVNGGDGSPHATRPAATVTPPLHPDPQAARRSRTAAAHRTGTAAPTRRRIAARRRRLVRRLTAAGSLAGVVMGVLAFLIPPAAALGVAVAAGVFYLANTK